MAKPRGEDPFPQETAKFVAIVNMRQAALASVCAMVGFGLGNTHMALLRRVSVKTIETQIEEAIRHLTVVLKLDFRPNRSQFVIICHEIIQERIPEIFALNSAEAKEKATHFVTLYKLSPRVAEVCALLGYGFNSREIARLQVVHPKTVESQLRKGRILLRSQLRVLGNLTHRQFVIVCYQIANDRVPQLVNPAQN